MKKTVLFFAVFLLVFQSIQAQTKTYKIVDSEINIEGSNFGLGITSSYAIEKNYPLDFNAIFSEEGLTSYLTNYKQSLLNSRFFEKIQIEYVELENNSAQSLQSDSANEETPQETAENSITQEPLPVKIIINLKDSKHLLAVPYATFDLDANKTAFEPKIKMKDTNFLGSMNPLALDFNIEISKKESEDFWRFQPGLNLSYDYPFHLGLFDITWVNDYELSYTFGYTRPEWDAKTGFKVELPFEKISFVFETYQYVFSDFDYEIYGDDLYFKEEFQFSTPIKLANLSNYSTLKYTPCFNFNWYWDADYIDKTNDDLSSPQFTLSHSLSNSKIDWENNFRNGYYLNLENAFMYNSQRHELSPSVAFEGKYYKSLELAERSFLDYLGLCTDLYAFTYFDLPDTRFNYGRKIGSRLRGIADESYFGNEKPDYTTSTALVLNIDLPVNLFRTNFKKDLINMNVQFSPFFDMALYRDRAKEPQFDTALCSGFEVLVYPKKWSSFIIRASLGFDLKKAFAEENIAKGLLKNKEILFGLGLLY